MLQQLKGNVFYRCGHCVLGIDRADDNGVRKGALAAVSAFRGVSWGMILYTADSLADVEKYDERNWGGNSYEYALTLCLDAVIKL